MQSYIANVSIEANHGGRVGTFLPGSKLDPRMFSEEGLERLIRERRVTVEGEAPATPKEPVKPARKVARKAPRRG